MRVLLVHNRYRQRGGEDAVFEAEGALLESASVPVDRLLMDNAEISDSMGPRERLKLAVRTTWSTEAYNLVRAAVRKHNADVVHFHNTFPLISPAGYRAARAEGAAVVQTLHNFRLICPNALLLRDDAPCEDCVGRVFSWPGVYHACYRESRSQTLAVAGMQTTHRLLRTWTREVDRYIALTEFSRGRFVDGGLPAELIEVKPNFISLAPEPEIAPRRGFLFVGRLERAKGVYPLIDAWGSLTRDFPLRIAGDGPLGPDAKHRARELSEIVWLGRVSREKVMKELVCSLALIVPSISYETFGLTIIEAFANGTPVIASRLGAMEELIEEGQTGLLFEPGNPMDLAEKVRWAAQNPQEMRRMGEAARGEFTARYAPGPNLAHLLAIYERAIVHRQAVG